MGNVVLVPSKYLENFNAEFIIKFKKGSRDTTHASVLEYCAFISITFYKVGGKYFIVD